MPSLSTRATSESSPFARCDLEAVLRRVLPERVDDLLPRRFERALGDVLADQVDRRDQRLGLQRQEARRAREVVAVRLRVHLDRVAHDLGVHDVAAAAEVDDVQHVDVLLQLLFGHVELLAERGEVELRALARGLDQDARERDEAREALRPDRRVALALVGLRPRRAPAWRAFGFAVSNVSRWRSTISSSRSAARSTSSAAEQARTVAELEHPGDDRARVGVLGLEHRAVPGASSASAAGWMPPAWP